MYNRDEEIEFRIVNDENLPPIVISMNDQDKPKVVLNQYHKIWLCLHRKIIAGGAQGLFDQIDNILHGFLAEMRQTEQMDSGDFE